ncbi:MAG: polyphosphate kinase [Actinomycetota bacterium]|nr:polyphosphate kinase [Actinomycetota bacterium]
MTHPAPSPSQQASEETSPAGTAGILREFPRAPVDSPYLNRELSWLDFNGRVLALADDDRAPVLERVKFLAIFSRNLDEFFQVRVALLKEQQDARVGGTSPDGLTPSEQLRVISTRVAELLDRQSAIFAKGVVPALADAGVVLSGWDSLDEDDRAHLIDVFETRIFPVLTPLAVDPGHPFPHISSLSLNLAVVVRNPRSGERRFARIKMPPLLPRFIAVPDKKRLIPIEQVIAARLDELFPGMEIESHCAFRVTRNADLDIEEAEADDLLEAIDLELRRRRFGKAVRLEVDSAMPDDVRELLAHELDLGPGDIYESDGPLDLGDLWALHGLDRPDLKDEPWIPVVPPALAGIDEPGEDIFSVLRRRDVLVHHPYESFTASTEAFIRQSAADPNVLAIKQTLYRTSGDSAIVKALIDAAEAGKQVVVLVELKARFDEKANIAWARALEQAGVHVVYGLVGLKTHTKTALVVREEADGLRRYCHVGTGNYNSTTARLYEDIGLLSSDPDLCSDLTHLFNFLTGYSRHVQYKRLLVATTSLRTRLTELIRNEVNAPEGSGRIVMKMNSLVDWDLISALYEASSGGVKIDLIVRGICCLRPGVPGLSENIKVRSIVGRYLEHSRIFAFGGRDERHYYIGSADLMPRNLDRRVEAVTPVSDPALTARLQEILDVDLADDTLAWDLGPDGEWRHIPPGRGCNTHDRLQELTLARARRDPERKARATPGLMA